MSLAAKTSDVERASAINRCTPGSATTTRAASSPDSPKSAEPLHADRPRLNSASRSRRANPPDDSSLPVTIQRQWQTIAKSSRLVPTLHAMREFLYISPDTSPGPGRQGAPFTCHHALVSGRASRVGSVWMLVSSAHPAHVAAIGDHRLDFPGRRPLCGPPSSTPSDAELVPSGSANTTHPVPSARRRSAQSASETTTRRLRNPGMRRFYALGIGLSFATDAHFRLL